MWSQRVGHKLVTEYAWVQAPKGPGKEGLRTVSFLWFPLIRPYLYFILSPYSQIFT